MTTSAGARAALAETLSQIRGGDVRQMNVIDRPPEGNLTVPAIYLGGRVGNRADQTGGRVIRFPVIGIAGTDLDYSHDILDRFVDGDLSIFDHIDAHPDLGTDDLSANIVDEWADTSVTIGGVNYVGVEFVVEVYL